MCMLNARVDITLPIKLIAELKKSVPKRKRSLFIANAVEDKLNRIKRDKGLEELAGIWDKAGGFKFSTDKELTQWRRKLWASFDRRTSPK